MSEVFQARFDAAINRAKAWLQSRGHDLRPLAPTARFPAGFRTSIVAGGEPFPLDVLFAGDYPVSPPRLRVSTALRGKIPHVEVDGQLCLFQNGTEFAVGAVETILEATFRDADRVLGSPSMDDFLDEFQSYWPEVSVAGLHSMILLSDVPPKSKTLVAAVGRTFACVAADHETLAGWLRKSISSERAHVKTDGALILRMPTGLLPSEHPRTLWDLMELFRRYDSDAHGRLAHQVWESSGEKLVVISFERSGQSVVGGIRFRSPRLAGHQELRVPRGSAAAGLKTSAVRSKLEQVRVVRMSTSIATHRHIHTRGGAGHSLEGKSVSLIGCGALGSHVAHLLAKAGVGELRLIDPQVLTRDNVGRHLLGSAQASMPKATALAQHLLQQLPHLSVAARCKPWQDVWASTPSDLLRCDLIVSTVGHWNTEFDLNALVRRQKGIPSVIFGWLEAYAAAGHSLFVHSTMGGCFSCGCDDIGSFEAAVIEPGFEAGRRRAGCGDFYQPYGSAEMMPVAAMIAQQAIDAVTGNLAESELRSWTGPQSAFTRFNLPLTQQWSDVIRTRPFGAGHTRQWVPSPMCRLCR